MTAEVSQVKDEENRNKSTAYIWKSTSLEPVIHNVSLRRGISKIALGSEHTLLLNFNCEIFSLGENSYGQLGLGDNTKRTHATVIEFFLDKDESKVIDVACGGYYSAVICENGEVFCWGDSSSGQCGIGNIKQTNEPVRVLFNEGDDLDEDSNSCSSNTSSTSSNCFGDHDDDDSKSTSDLGEKDVDCYQVKQLSCGDVHALALTEDGQVWSWGSGCQVGHGIDTERVVRPQKIGALRGKKVTSVACGAYHSMVLVQDDSVNCNAIRGRTTPRKKSAPSTKEVAKKLNRQRSSSSKERSGCRSPSMPSKTRAVSVSAPPGGSFLENYASERRDSESARTYLSYNSASSELKNSKDVENKTSMNDNTSIGKNMTLTPLGQFEATELHVRKDVKEKDSDTTNCVLNVVDGESKDIQPLEVCESHFGASSPSEIVHDVPQLEGRYLVGDKSASQVEQKESSNTCTNCSPPDTHPESILISSKEKLSAESVEQLSGMGGHYECVTPPTPSSSSSAGSTSYFGSTDSDSEDMPLKRKVSSSGSKPSLKSKSSWTSPKQENLQDRVSLGLAALGSKLKPDVNLTKLTSAVLESVSGMFMSAMPSDMPAPGAKAIESGAYCQRCGIYGICLCPVEEVSRTSDFALAGSNVQVWSWGMGGCGQLGQGDTDDRSIPCNIKSLTGVGVVKIAAGTFHSLALTTYSQVYSWGDNSCGQLGRKKSILLVPKKLKCLSDVLVWDISAGSHYSLFIGDGALSQPDVYVCGRQPSGLPMLATSATRVKEGITEPVDVKAEKTSKNKLNRMRSSSSFDDVKERSLRNSRVEVVRLTMFRKVGQLRGVFANTENCCCLAARTQGGQLPILYELASSERVFYYQLALIWQVIIVPILHSEVWSTLHSQDDGQVFAAVVKNFYHLMECVSSNLVVVTEIAQNMGSCQELFDFCLSESFFTAFERYAETFSDAVAFGAFRTITKTSNDVIFQCRAILNELLEDFDNSGISNWQSLQTVLEIPLERIQNYKRVFSKLMLTAQTKGVVNTRLTERMEMWSDLISDCENKLTVADFTREIWEEGPSKVIEVMKVPKRRIVRNSKVYILFPSKTHRFASHWFLLFNDYFVHIQSAKNFQTYSLKTLWAEGVDDSEGLLNGIKLTTPEETLLLCAPTSTDKADWLVAINQAVANVISRTTSYRLSSGAVNMLTGNLTAASAREAPHTFTLDNRYRGAAYKGMWLTGKPHGHGELLWPDGRRYTGEFRNGYQHGEGAMVWPDGTCPAPDSLWVRYEGQWEEGKIAGYGKMRYSNGDRYSGSWRESMRHGHGSMRSGSVSSAAATVYLGEWVNDRKCGYGVQDEILKGEKYMGMWENDCRQGSGVIVTVEGIYNEGIFVQNKLMGIGLLLSDDNTKYEGEFTGNCHLAGKGVLTMPNGDYIEGSFTGLWGEGIKITGTFYKSDCYSDAFGVPGSPTQKAKTVVPPSKKWTALFQQCREALGCRRDHDCDTQTAWKYVSIALLSGHDGKLPRNQQDVMQELLNTNNEVERTGKPASCDLETMQGYLSRAFELRYHPFGQLVEGLVDVFRASYVGMGTHRRLLSHAVAEVKSFVQRLYSLVRLLFSDLPNEDFVHLATDTVTGVANHCTEEGIISSALLHPLLFPRLYPTLFTLYALRNEKHDSKYWERISQLNKRSDVALMTHVGMKRKFWLSRDNELDNCGSDELKESYRAPKHYVSAVETLQQISTKFSPMEKLSLLKTTFEKINEEVELFWQGEEKLVSLDDIFPVFQFVVLRSRIPHLGSEIQFIDDMVDSHVHVGEQGHMFTTLKACYFQIHNEKAL